jgi:hypothetical protein
VRPAGGPPSASLVWALTAGLGFRPRGARQEGSLIPVDRWAGTEGQEDRWAGSDGQYDPRTDTYRQYDGWAETDSQRDPWVRTDTHYDRSASTDGRDDRWAEIDTPNDGPQADPRRSAFKWVGLLLVWVLVARILLAVHLIILIWVIMAGLIGYVAYCIVRATPSARRSARRRASAGTGDNDREQFNSPPGWPEPPPGWTPPPGWQPSPAWGPAPPGWQFWGPRSGPVLGRRTARSARTARAPSHRSQRRSGADQVRLTGGWG